MPPKPARTPAAEILTSVTMDLFRVDHLILNAGDRLAAHLGLTGTRWQILGAAVRSTTPQTVAGLSRDLGSNRQNVQRVIHDLVRMELLSLEANPKHRRAPLVVLTAKGRQTYDAAMKLQAPWANAVTEGMGLDDLLTFQRVIAELRARLTPRPGLTENIEARGQKKTAANTATNDPG